MRLFLTLILNCRIFASNNSDLIFGVDRFVSLYNDYQNLLLMVFSKEVLEKKKPIAKLKKAIIYKTNSIIKDINDYIVGLELERDKDEAFKTFLAVFMSM